VLLFMDETILTETPPLRKAWARRGEQALVPITGNRDKRVLYGALHIKTGSMLLYDALYWNQEEVQVFLLMICKLWRGRHIVLFLDRGSPHTAETTVDLAAELHIELRWLPTACPKLNPMDHLWRHLKNDVLPNEAISLDETVERTYDYFANLTPTEMLAKAGVLSEAFWLADTIQKTERRLQPNPQ
jgi:hypothetical protein